MEEEKKSHKRISPSHHPTAPRKKVGRVHFWAQKRGGGHVLIRVFLARGGGKRKRDFYGAVFWSGKRREMKVRHRIFSSAFSLGSVRSGGSAQLSRVRNKMSAAAAFLCAKVQVVRRFIFSGGERGRKRH